MKIFAHHDPKGSLNGIVTVNVPKNAGLVLSPKAGIYVTELERVKFKSKSPTFEELQQIAKKYIDSKRKTKSSIKKK